MAWILTFKSEGAGPPEELRIRRLLKFALRGCGLRCIDYGNPDEDKAALADKPKPSPRLARQLEDDL